MKLFNLTHSLAICSAVFIVGMLSISACTEKNQQQKKEMNHSQTSKMQDNHMMNHAFAAPIEKAQKMDAWKSKGALKANVDFTFGGHTSNATMFVQTDGPGIRLEMGKNKVGVYNGRHMWSMPTDSSVSSFQIKTWGYFLKAPYKLDDPGTQFESKEPAKLNGKSYDRAKLTFDAGTGDSPKDWFILYRDQNTNRLHAMAFIVTYGKTMKEAQKHPEAITYEDFQNVDGIPISTKWELWKWSEQKGLSDKPIGHAMLSNLKFVPTNNMFSKPEGKMQE